MPDRSRIPRTINGYSNWANKTADYLDDCIVKPAEGATMRRPYVWEYLGLTPSEFKRWKEFYARWKKIYKAENRTKEEEEELLKIMAEIQEFADPIYNRIEKKFGKVPDILQWWFTKNCRFLLLGIFISLHFLSLKIFS